MYHQAIMNENKKFEGMIQAKTEIQLKNKLKKLDCFLIPFGVIFRNNNYHKNNSI